MGHGEGMESEEGLKQAELALLGAAIVSGGRGLDDLDFDPSDFQSPILEHVWRTMTGMIRDGKPVDQVSLWGALESGPMKVSPTLVHEAVTAAPVATATWSYAAIVADAAARRRLRQAGSLIAGLADKPGEVDALIEEARRKLDDYGKVTKSEPVLFAYETMEGTLDRLDSADPFIPTPWDGLNDIIGGLRPGGLYTIGARPGAGKSVCGIQLAESLAHHGSVAMLSLEMSQDDVNKRLLAHQKHIPMERLTNPKTLTHADYAAMGEWLETNRLPIAVHKGAQVTLTDIRRFSRNVHRRVPLAGVIVDYLQLMAQAPNDKRGRQEFVADMSRGLKLLAIDMNVPVVMLSQLNRGSSHREDKRPVITDLRESGAIEQDSDVVILLHRDTMDPELAHRLEMSVAKNRHGRPGVVDLEFAGHYSEIR